MPTVPLVTRGAKTAVMVQAVCDMLLREAVKPLVEHQLPNGQRLDVAAVNHRGEVIGIEVKSSASDFNRDTKWASYIGWCTAFFLAVPVGFDLDRISPGIGIILVEGSHARWYARFQHPTVARGQRSLWQIERAAMGLPLNVHRRWWRW